MNNDERLKIKASKLAREKGSLIATINIRHSYSTHMLDRGYLIEISSKFPVSLDPEPVGNHHQYVGIHNCLVLTIRRPERVTTMLDVSRDLPRIEPFGDITWLGAATVVKSKRRKKRPATQLLISRQVWAPSKAGVLDHPIVCQGIIHPHPSARSTFIYFLLEIPAIQDRHVLPDYLMGEQYHGER